MQNINVKKNIKLLRFMLDDAYANKLIVCERSTQCRNQILRRQLLSLKK